MTIAEARQSAIKQAKTQYEEREANNIASLLLTWISGFNKIDQLLHKEQLLTDAQQIQFTEATIKLATGEPIQYIIGEAWFMGMPFIVNSSTLIPRPETEELVELILHDYSTATQSSINLVDIGTGSGCIPISLKIKLPNFNASAIDISNEAINIAQQNAKHLNAAVNFFELNFLAETNWQHLSTYDIIVSNPPYIKLSEKQTMHTNVVNFEPHIALFVPDNDPLIFYRKIAKFSNAHLNKGGSIYLEINEALGQAVIDLFGTNFEVTLKKDMQGKDRMIRAIKKQ